MVKIIIFFTELNFTGKFALKIHIYTLPFPYDYVTGISEVATPIWAIKLVDECWGIVEKCHNIILSYVYVKKNISSNAFG